MKKIYLIYYVDFIEDGLFGAGMNLLWSCDSLKKAVDNVSSLREKFLERKKLLGLIYDERYFYKKIDLY